MDNDLSCIQELKKDDLSFTNWLAIAWSFFWRGLIIVLLSMLCGALVGGLLGFIVGLVCVLVKIPFDGIKLPFQIAAGTIGCGIGFLFIIVQLRWALNAKYKGFRLAIIKDDK